MDSTLGPDIASLDFNFSKDDPVSCLFCMEIFMVNVDIQPLLKHLIEIHKFIIAEPEGVADFRQYILYWQKLRNLPLDDYCIVYFTNTEPGTKEIKETFYMLCDKLTEDKQIRNTIRQAKLNYLTRQKESEYRDKSFSRKCIYCQQTVGGGLASSFQHLAFDHGFSIGKPDNIVFGAKLLDLMEEKLKRLQCLNCEKTFKSHPILREHMRKKQHKSLNPKNKIYDKFYLLNYLKPGTPWEEAKKDTSSDRNGDGGECLFEASEMANKDQLHSDDEHLWTDWREDSTVPAICLFCPFTTTKVPNGLYQHMRSSHNFDFEDSTKDHNFYLKIKVINFIRFNVSSCQCITCQLCFTNNEDLLSHMESTNHCRLPSIHVWDLPQYLIPFYENDGLLFHIEDDEEECDTSSLASSVNEEIVLPEDMPIIPTSILEDWRLREEISTELNKFSMHSNHLEASVSNRGDLVGSNHGNSTNHHGTSTNNYGYSTNNHGYSTNHHGNHEESRVNFARDPSILYECLFCRHVGSGFDGRNVVMRHMLSMHNFKFWEVFANLTVVERGKAINYIRHMTNSKTCFVCDKKFVSVSLLEEHRTLKDHLYLPAKDKYQDVRWETRTLSNDGFL